MYLPEDVILAILLRLPVLSLLRFRCVCTQWCALIKSCAFKDNYLALRHAMDEGDDVFVLNRKLVYGKSFVTGCYSDYESLLALSVSSSSSRLSSNSFEQSDIFPSWMSMSIINHVNGIVCFGGENLFSTTLLNPSIRKVRKVPVPDLGFECYTQGLGLGFDSATNDYKVVGMVTVVEGGEGPYHKHLALVYRLSTNTWTISGELPAFVSQYYYQVSRYYLPHRILFLGWFGGPMPCIFSHGSIHWVVTAKKKNRILAFDMTSELFQEIQFPHALKDYKFGTEYKLFGVDRSTIALVAFSFPADHLKYPQWLDVWVMKEYGVTESWTKQYSIRSLPERVRPLSLWRKDKLLLQTKNEELICYDLSRGQMYGPYLRGVCVATCNESLVSIK